MDTKLKSRIKKSGYKPPVKRKEPLWKGPEEDGITYSLLSRFLVCRERFRLLVVEGWSGMESFYAPIHYGLMWHVCEEAAASEVRHFKGNLKGTDTTLWLDNLKEYCIGLMKQFKSPTDHAAVNHWYEVCKTVFPYYVEYWRKHPDVKGRRPLLQEQVFNVPYKLPSGRTVRLRGKWDSVDLIGSGKAGGIWLQENKTKSEVNRLETERQLKFDLQTMIYVVALEWTNHHDEKGKGLPAPKFLYGAPFKGVRYNVVKRPQHKIMANLRNKLDDDLEQKKLDEWFGRWNVEITAADVARFRRECLDPILENLCDWWQHMKNCAGDPAGLFRERFSTAGDDTWVHWRHPFGVYNVLNEGGSSDLDALIETGSTVGLVQTESLFGELE